MFALPQRARIRQVGWIVLIGAILLLIFRLLLPGIVLNYVNKTLDEIPGYEAKVGGIDIALWRGAYVIRNLVMLKEEGKKATPFVEIPRIDLSMEWMALFRGKIVGEVLLVEPKIHLIQLSKNKDSVPDESSSWAEQGKKLFPFDLNKLVIRNGLVVYQDAKAQPPVDLRITQIQAHILNITNKPKPNNPLPTSFDLNALVLGSGQLVLQGNAQLFSKPLDFKTDLKLENVDLTELNPYVKEKAGFDFTKGRFDLYGQLTATQGQLDGYIKPIFTGIGIVDRRKFSNPVKAVWETVVSTLVQSFTNQPKDQFATVIPITGSVDNPNTLLIPTLWNVFKNAFFGAFLPGFEQTPIQVSPKK